MSPEIKKEWVEELRSGRHRQIKGVLETKLGKCCLGVLCHLAEKHGAVERRAPNEQHACAFYDNASQVLPHSVAVWAGLGSVNPTVPQTAGQRPVFLTSLNDGQGLTFQQIADLIEEKL